MVFPRAKKRINPSPREDVKRGSADAPLSRETAKILLHRLSTMIAENPHHSAAVSGAALAWGREFDSFDEQERAGAPRDR
jgi:hypothetical protein